MHSSLYLFCIFFLGIGYEHVLIFVVIATQKAQFKNSYVNYK